MTYNSEFGSHVSLYRDRIKQVIDDSLNEHPNTMIIRVDLHDPVDTESLDNPFFQPKIDSGAISRFTSALKAKLGHDKHIKTQRKEWPDTRHSALRYAWVREYTKNGKRHYHLILCFNQDAYYHLGDYDLNRNTLRTMITTAWYSALGIPIVDSGKLVNYPSNGKYLLNRKRSNFEQTYNDLMNRVNYMTKVRTKIFGDGDRNFGCSRG
ncbi:inovirus Gp2 family protein [Cronobacter turicensis]|nr:inovirus Gp2 family protein [Cronobacter turicensis]EMA1792506.1 inovirus Gp2 family protein [Cronobacter turicensis]EMA1801336.1 inovirus Gp2 family protein [Cronobacter turicensis]EMA1850094.1 inovirus Gp2 family protein [Cronobacter turicensis]EMA1860108.1 inovirus Gp2 family protein [Cronobacter turicensis]